MRRFALFSDVHGNLPALDAVLADIGSRGLSTDTYCLGDLVGYGPDPAGVVDRIRRHAIPTIKGNYDDGIGERRGDCGCYYATDQARKDGAASYAFTDAALTDDARAWLASLPETLRFEAEGLRVLLAHGSPRKINEYLLPDRTDRQLSRLAVEADADVVCIGHVHVPYHRSMTAPDGHLIHYISAGSVGKPKDGDSRAGWVEVEIGPPGHEDARVHEGSAGTEVRATVHRVEYDVEAVAAAMRDAGLPETLVQALLRGGSPP